MVALSTAELGVLDWIAQHLHTVFLDHVMPWLSRLTDRGEVWILLGLLLLFFYRKDRGVGVQVLVALLFSLLICNLVLKNAVGRMRPGASGPILPIGAQLGLLRGGHGAAAEPLGGALGNAGAGGTDRIFSIVSLCPLPNGCVGRHPRRRFMRGAGPASLAAIGKQS